MKMAARTTGTKGKSGAVPAANLEFRVIIRGKCYHSKFSITTRSCEQADAEQMLFSALDIMGPLSLVHLRRGIFQGAMISPDPAGSKQHRTVECLPLSPNFLRL
jgi:hypothetical protein